MWKWIRIPKGIALLAFLLPWMTVSCSGQKLVEASGFGLAFGRVSAMGRASQASDGASMNVWLIRGWWHRRRAVLLSQRRETRKV